MNSGQCIELMLFILGLLAIISIAQTMTVLAYDSPSSVYYDSGGHAVCRDDFSALGEVGEVYSIKLNIGSADPPYAYWKNASWPTLYCMYTDVNGQNPLLYSTDNGGAVGARYGGRTVWYSLSGANDTSSAFGLSSALFAAQVNVFSGGLSALMVGIVAFIVLVSVNVLSTGINAEGTRLLTITAFYSGLWVLISSLSISSLFTIPLFGVLIYCLMTFIYFLGVWGQINGGGVF